MKIRFLLFAVFIFSLRVYSQDATSYGPRAGIGYLSNSGTSDLKEGIHSAFGWQVEVPYSNDKLTDMVRQELCFWVSNRELYFLMAGHISAAGTDLSAADWVRFSILLESDLV